MTLCRRLFAAAAVSTTVTMSLGLGCTPSNNASRGASASTDSAADTKREAASADAPVASDPGQTSPDPSGPLADPVVTAPAAQPMLGRPVYVPPQTGRYRVRIVDEAQRDLPTYNQGGRSYVMGTIGARYSIVVSNPTAERVEAVISVDGLDAMDGHPADYVAKRGYVLPPHGDLSVDGYRTSYNAVATFRFSSVADSYAGRLGEARDVGVIGVAFFPEKVEAPLAQVYPSSGNSPRVYKTRARPTSIPRGSSTPFPAAPGRPSGGGGGAEPQAHASAAPTPRADSVSEVPSEDRRGLGTEFGEARESRVGSTSFDRASVKTPAQIVSFRYNDRAGLQAIGIRTEPLPRPVDRDLRERETAEPFRENRFAQAPP